MRRVTAAILGAAAACALGGAAPAPVDYAAQLRDGDYVAKDFRFADGETMAALRLHYATLGTPHRDAKGHVDNAVMILHGTGGTGRQFMQPQFAQELYGPGQPLDITRYFIILPDGIGHGKSSKPSDGMRMKFPKYDYSDMVEAQRLMVTKGLNVDRLRLIFGTSMGCMHGFIWGEKHSDIVDAIMPMACEPMQIAGLNRMWRELSIQTIEKDPAWKGGDYASEPLTGIRGAVSIAAIAGGAPLNLQKLFPTRAAADAYITARVDKDVLTRDANDYIYQLQASRTYDPSKELDKITVPFTWINSADDFINPRNFGFAEAAIRKIPKGRFRLIPESTETHGHGTHTWAVFWKKDMIELLNRSMPDVTKP